MPMLKLFTCLLAFFICLLGLSAQSLPDEMHFSPDGHRLITGGTATTGLYDETQVRQIDLIFPQANYWSLLTQNYTTKVDLPATMMVEGQTWDSVGVRFKGQTSYSMAGNTQKKSFNISLRAFKPDHEKWLGYQTFNLNNCFLDASFLREFFFLHQIRHHIPAAKSAFVHLYLNGQDWGIYPSVQQLNGDFLEEWFLSNNGTCWRADRPTGTGGGGPGGGGPGWGDGTAALNYLGADTALYKPYYTLKSTTSATPWDDLVNTCDVLNNTPAANLATEAATVLDLDRTLWFLASEIAFTDDDSYVYKGKMDYYLYYEQETGRITPLEYDGNSTFDLSLISGWTPFYNANKVNYPLLNKLLAVPSLRQRYLAHLRTIRSELLDPAVVHPKIDAFAAQINDLVQSDPKKIYTYNQFLTEVTELKTFVTNRYANLISNAEMAQVAPVIADATQWYNGLAWSRPEPAAAAQVRATVSSTNGIDRVNLYYSNELAGNFSVTQMFDDGQHNDGAALDGTFGGTIPGFAGQTWVRWYVEAVSANTAKSVSYLPVGAEHDVFVYQVLPAGTAGGSAVVINEVLASNQNGAVDENGDLEDWIELYNTGSQAVDLTGYFITDNPANVGKWQFPAGTVLNPDSYLILWADEDGNQGDLHLNFKLSASGEQIYLVNPDSLIIDQVVFGQQTPDVAFARIPNGSGPFVQKAPTFAANNEQSSGTQDDLVRQGMILQPNPATQQVLLSTPDAGTVQVFDLMGRLMYWQRLTADMPSSTMSLAGWPSGQYLVEFRSDAGGVGVKKLIKI
jgi:hypothetical protein